MVEKDRPHRNKEVTPGNPVLPVKQLSVNDVLL